MQTQPHMICDRCGVERIYIKLDATNGTVAWHADLCFACYSDVKAMMLNANNRHKPNDGADRV